MHFPAFNRSVPDNGYSWWYLDAYSDDQQHALTLIAFVGSVFSPYYAWARKKSAPASSVSAENHCAFNLALYGKTKRWCMTERGHRNIDRTEQRFDIGPSSMRLQNQELHCKIVERSVPFPTRLCGSIRVRLPETLFKPRPIDTDQRHMWQPIAPQTRIEVNFERPDLRWKGFAYMDSNWGSVPLEQSFESWTWSRSHHSDGSTVVQYDTCERQPKKSTPTVPNSSTMTFHGNSMSNGPEMSQDCQLPKTRYFRIPRTTRLTKGMHVLDLQTLEDAPFYARSRFRTEKAGSQAICMHESLDLNRFDSNWVRSMLPFRMPRITRQTHQLKSRVNHV